VAYFLGAALYVSNVCHSVAGICVLVTCENWVCIDCKAYSITQNRCMYRPGSLGDENVSVVPGTNKQNVKLYCPILMFAVKHVRFSSRSTAWKLGQYCANTKSPKSEDSLRGLNSIPSTLWVRHLVLVLDGIEATIEDIHTQQTSWIEHSKNIDDCSHWTNYCMTARWRLAYLKV